MLNSIDGIERKVDIFINEHFFFSIVFFNIYSNMNEQAYVCICMYMYAYTGTCVFEHTCVCVHVHIFVWIGACMCVFACMNMFLSACFTNYNLPTLCY